MAELELVPEPEDEPVTTAELRAQLQRIEDERLVEEASEPEPAEPTPEVRTAAVQPRRSGLMAKRVIRDEQGRIEYILEVPIEDVPMPEAPSGEAQ